MPRISSAARRVRMSLGSPGKRPPHLVTKAMELRRATPADATLLAEHRRAVWCEVGAGTFDELAPQVAAWATYLTSALASETFVAFVAQRDGRTIGSGGLLLQVVMPRAGFASDRAGRVHSLYVASDARRCGVGRAIMHRLIAYARDASFASLTLRPSDEARPLYAALGFEVVDEMRLSLTDR